MKKKQPCFQNHAKNQSNLSLNIKHNTPSRRNSIWKVQGLPPNKKTGHKHLLKLDINMHHSSQERDNVFPTKKIQNFDTKAQSATQCMDDLKAWRWKILISGNSPSLAQDLSQFLLLGNCGLKFLTYERIVFALSCVFHFCVGFSFHKAPLAFVYLTLRILGLALQITDKFNKPKGSFGLISAILAFVAKHPQQW